MKRAKLSLTLRQITLFGILGALTFGAKFAMSSLYNIEPVSLMVMLFAVVFGWKGLYPVYLYVLLEVLTYGLNIWNIYYLYVWAILAIAAIFMQRLKHPIWWALLSGLFGLAFGPLCSITNFCMYGFSAGLAWLVAGLRADVLHAIGNFVIALVLFVPLRKLMTRLYKRLQ